MSKVTSKPFSEIHPTITGRTKPKNVWTIDTTELDVLAESRIENRLRRHLIEHGTPISLATQIARHYHARVKTNEHESWLKKLVDILLSFNHVQ